MYKWTTISTHEIAKTFLEKYPSGHGYMCYHVAELVNSKGHPIGGGEHAMCALLREFYPLHFRLINKGFSLSRITYLWDSLRSVDLRIQICEILLARPDRLIVVLVN